MVIWLGLIQTATAYDTIGSTWPPDERPIAYSIHSELGGSFDEDAVVTAIQAGFATWENVDCADISFEYQGRTDSVWGALDGTNTVYLIDVGWPEEASMLSTPMIVTDGGEIVEVDIALNIQHFAWSIENADGIVYYDIQAAITHEVGHLLGLWHSTEVGASLNPTMAGHPEASSLEDDDIDGLCDIYNQSTTIGGEVGDSCSENADCSDELCLADGNKRYCSQFVRTDSECPDGWECLEAGDQQVCAQPEDASNGCTISGPSKDITPWVPLLVLGWVRRRR